MAHSPANSLSALLPKDDGDDDPLPIPSRRTLRPRLRPVLAVALLAVIALLSAVLLFFWVRSPLPNPQLSDVQDSLVSLSAQPPAVQEHVSPPDPWREQVAHWVNGDPADSVHDNLRPATQYLTVWVSGGWTNDFMTYINMIYLSLLTARIPILPPFAPSHVDYDAGFPPFGDIFDIPALSRALGDTPILEWRDVKRANSSTTDPLGCWSIWAMVGDDGGRARDSLIPQQLRLNVSYTPIPASSERVAGLPTGPWLPFSSLAELSSPTEQQHPGAPPPDERLMCFDFMYYVGALHHDEWWAAWSPAWRIVGRHARWTPALDRLAAGFVRRALGLPDDENTSEYPPYIAVHVRRGDFTAACGPIPRDECFPPLSTYARRVAQVRSALLLSLPAHVTTTTDLPVLVTSDETDHMWWEAVAMLGWRRVDHAREGTAVRLGKWYVPLVDAVVQSRAVGFVGTDRSTMSLVARRRVEAWQGGVGYLVRIGSQNADDY